MNEVDYDKIQPALDAIRNNPKSRSGWPAEARKGREQMARYRASLRAAWAAKFGRPYPQSDAELRLLLLEVTDDAGLVMTPELNRDAAMVIIESRLLRRREAANSAALPTQPPAEPLPTTPPDGPFGKAGFRWKGKEHHGLTPQAFRLVNALWTAEENTLDYDTSVAALHGSKDDAPPDPLHRSRKEANRFFRAEKILLCVSTSGPRRRDRVSLAAKQPKQPRKRATKIAKRP